MSYIGGLTKAQLLALISDAMKPFMQQVNALTQHFEGLHGQLTHVDKELYTIDDLSKQFKVSKATIHNWAKQGKLIKYKTGARTLFKHEDVQKFINYSKNV